MRFAFLLSCLFAFVTCVAPACGQGRIGRIRQEVRQDHNDNDNDKDDDHDDDHSHNHHGYRLDDDDDDTDVGLGFLFVFLLNGNTNPDAKYLAYPAYPYPLGLPGYLQEDPTPLDHLGRSGEQLVLKDTSIRFSLENGNDFNGLNRLQGSMLVETVGFGLYSQWNWLHENLDGGGTDDASLGNINLTYQFASDTTAIVRLGAGAWIFTDRMGTDAGWNVHLSADLFPVEPWVASYIVEGGTIGDAGIFHLRGTIGYLFDGLEIFAGYDYMSINDVSIQGPLAGLRLWF